MGEPAASPPRRECRGRNEQPREFPEAGRGCQLLIGALGADLKRQDLAPNSGNLLGTPGAAVAPRTWVAAGRFIPTQKKYNALGPAAWAPGREAALGGGLDGVAGPRE